MTDGIKELLHIQNTMSEFLPVGLPMPLEVDNKGAGYMAENDINNKRTKHIDIRYHFIRNHIADKTVELFYIETSNNITDIFTKALPVPAFVRFAKRLLGLTADVFLPVWPRHSVSQSDSQETTQSAQSVRKAGAMMTA